MTWRRFAVLLRGLSPDALFRHLCRNEPRVLTAAEALAYAREKRQAQRS